MIQYLLDGQIDLFILALIAIIISLSFHEFGHAFVAKQFGDNTAERAGRLTINPIAHIDPMGLLMVATVGFGYAKPVPTDPRNFNSPYASGWVAAAGPLMNLLLAFLSINILAFGIKNGVSTITSAGPMLFLQYLVFINLLLMLFNLLPIGLLDGHYIVPYFLSRDNAIRFIRWNQQYGNMILFSFIILSIMGVPIFSVLRNLAMSIAQYLVIF